MKKPDKHYTCRACKKEWSAPPRQGKDPEYCSDKCRGKNKNGLRTWNLVCKTCNKEWTLQAKGGRKPHFCPECYKTSAYERHKRRMRERDRSYVTDDSVHGEKMVKWIPAEPLIKFLQQSLFNNDDWSIPTSRDRSAQTQMANRLGVGYNDMTRYMKPGAMMNAYIADKYAIALRPTPNTYLGPIFLCSTTSC